MTFGIKTFFFTFKLKTNMPTAIEINNLSKLYRLGVVGSRTLKDDLQRWWWRVRGKGDPLLKIGEENRLDSRSGDNYVWALRDINLEVEQGEVLGIIGKNGAGKSTLLKILSRITSPTTGEVKIRGRLGSLLEVGTGFHPELTGRENIYLNGAILGMKRSEIDRKFDDIVDFAGVAKYIDTPVKRYSSGMYVRLGFAVAAFLEPDILVVDEVLAVGDAEFQKRAIGKMQDVSRGEGRTVLFVSHNMGSIRNLCDRVILLDKGKIINSGEPDLVIENYLRTLTINDSNSKFPIKKNELIVHQVKAYDQLNNEKYTFLQSEPIFIKINYTLKDFLRGYRINIWFKTVYGELAFISSSHKITQTISQPGTYELILKVNENLLNQKKYIIAINVGIPGIKSIIEETDLFEVNIVSDFSHGSTFIESWPGIVAPKLEWKFKKLNK